MSHPQSPKRKKESKKINQFLTAALRKKMGSAKKDRKAEIFFAHFGCYCKLFAYYLFKTPNAKIRILRIFRICAVPYYAPVPGTLYTDPSRA